MKITIYELLGKVKDDKDTSIYVKYINRISQKEEIMWACKENIIYKLDQLIIKLNDEVEIIEEEKEIEKIKWDEKSLCQGFMTINKVEEMLMHRSEQLKKSLNQLIDEISKLKKGNDDLSIK